MVSEKQTFTQSEDDPFPFTTLRNEMEADGFPEETIVTVIGNNQDNPAAAREVYELLRESKVRQGELSASTEHETGQEAPVPMSVQEKMGARAVGDRATWRISGTLDDEKESVNSPAPQAPAPTYSAPPQTDVSGMDLSEEGIKAYVRRQHGR